MKTARKIIAILLLVVVVLLLPFSLLLKNTGSVLFSAEQVEGLVDEHILTNDVMRGVFKPYVIFEADRVEKKSTLQVVEAWETIGDDEWNTVIDELALIDSFSTSAKPTLDGVMAWIKGSANNLGDPLDLMPLKSQAVPVEEITDILIDAQPACTPEQEEMYHSLEPYGTVIVSVVDHLIFKRTIYEITFHNPNNYAEYVLDEIGVDGHEYMKWSTVYVEPDCRVVIGQIIPPSSEEFLCNFESETRDQPELIQSVLKLKTTKIEADELVVCSPSSEYYDTVAVDAISANADILPAALNQFPDEVDISTLIDENSKQIVTQAYQVSTYGWLAILGIFIIAVLIGAGFTKDILKWAGWPLLIAGLFTLGIALYLNSAVDSLWNTVSISLQTLPEYLFEPVKALFTDVIGMLSSSTMMQGIVVAAVGLVTLIVGLVFGKKARDY